MYENNDQELQRQLTNAAESANTGIVRSESMCSNFWIHLGKGQKYLRKGRYKEALAKA